MKLKRIGVVAGLSMLVASGALAQKVTTDHAQGVDFNRFKTFTWIKEPKMSNSLQRQRVIDDVNAALASKGLKAVTSNGDLGIAAHAATQQEHTLNTFYDGFGGGWRWGGGPGFATTTVDTFEVGTLVIDLFDTQTKETVWRGTSTKTLSDNPEKNAASLNKAINKMFEKFPPPLGKH